MEGYVVHCIVLLISVYYCWQDFEMIKVIVAGGRDFYDYGLLCNVLDYQLSRRTIDEVEIVCGMARGADLLGKKYADSRGIKVVEFPADWDTKGKAAGYVRNADMADYATHLVLFWDGESKGSKHMYDLANKKGLVVKVVRY